MFSAEHNHTMSLEIDVLRALLRLARRRTAPSMEELLLRVEAEPPDVLQALSSLARRGFVRRTGPGIGLTLGGFAVAVAVAKRRPALKKPLLLTRRGRHAA
jgi:DNA-binding IclR family transcriptional regulator